jgi:hypothetical protein
LIREQAQIAGPNEGIHLLPGHVAGFLFHDPEAVVAVGRAHVGLLERAQHVNFAREIGGLGFDGGGAFDGDEINRIGEVEVIEAMAQRAEVGGDGRVGRGFVQDVRLHPDERDDGVAAEPAPIHGERGIMLRRGRHRHRHLAPIRHGLAPMSQPHLGVQALDAFIFQLEPVLPFEARTFVEGSLGEMTADSVVNLPADELGMTAQRLGHLLDDALGIVPIDVAVQTDGAAGAFMFDLTAFINRQNLRMLLGQPERRGRGGRGENHFQSSLAHHIHHAPQPGEIKLAVFWLAKAPGKFAKPHHVEARLGHEARVNLPLFLGVFRGAAVREDPLLRMIINAEIHRS